ncbi:MAG: hypothetical protein WA496_02800 [Candidatus Udaeobacter sp.]
MDEELDSFAQRYALRRNIKLGERLGFGIQEIFPFLKRLGETKFLRSPRRPPLQLIRGDHESFNRLARDEPIHNRGDVRSRNASVKKVIGFD